MSSTSVIRIVQLKPWRNAVREEKLSFPSNQFLSSFFICFWRGKSSIPTFNISCTSCSDVSWRLTLRLLLRVWEILLRWIVRHTFFDWSYYGPHTWKLKSKACVWSLCDIFSYKFNASGFPSGSVLTDLDLLTEFLALLDLLKVCFFTKRSVKWVFMKTKVSYFIWYMC